MNWSCIDCGINTVPGYLTREQMEQVLAADWTDEGIAQTYGELTKIYLVKE